MHQADVRVDDRRHRLVHHLRIAVRDADRVVFMQAEKHARIAVAEMFDDGVVQAAIARARIEAHILEAEAAQHLRGDVGAPCDLVVGLTFGSVEIHFLS